MVEDFCSIARHVELAERQRGIAERASHRSVDHRPHGQEREHGDESEQCKVAPASAGLVRSF
jgi:hypothetical protein